MPVEVGTHAKRCMRAHLVALAACSAVSAQVCTPGFHSVGGGMNNSGHAQVLYRELDHDRLFVGGRFITAGGVPTGPVARWDGLEWSAVGSITFQHAVFAMIVHDDGTGPALYIGGLLEPIPGFDSNGVARWNGTSWSPVGTGLTPTPDFGIRAFATFDDGSGPALYAGAGFTVPGHPTGSSFNIARWDGAAWMPVAIVDHRVFAMHPFDDGTGMSLYVTGTFHHIAGISAAGAARWNGSSWEEITGSWSRIVGNNFLTADSGPERRLYLGGSFYGSAQTHRAVANWTGTEWDVLAVADEGVAGLAVWDDGTGPQLYVSGAFSQIGGIAAFRIARFDGQSWWPLQGTYPGIGSAGRLLPWNDDPAGPALYVVGGLGLSSSNFGRGIARYTTCNFPEPCYANCDGSDVEPVLNVEDFICFVSEFAQGLILPHEQQVDHYANCDGSSAVPVLNVDDFLCFMGAFAAGCW
jgi:trimeric autotransporter adhesin